MKNIYLFSGLASDERVFQQLDLSGFQTIFVPWLSPGKEESIEQYAHRMAQKIHGEKPVLIGLSFGGIMAIEIAKIIDTEKVILISSVKQCSELPHWLRLVGKTGLIRWVPIQFFKHTDFFIYWLFNARQQKDKNFLKTLIKDADPILMKWSLLKTVNWKNRVVPDNLVQIHGTKDHIFPVRHIQANYTIDNSGHFMVINHAQEVSKILRKVLLEKSVFY
jgi:pimeloyl-ACP methyl ester carboxylesterase